MSAKHITTNNSNKKKIIIIVSAIVVIIAAIVLVVFFAFGNKNKNNNTATSTAVTTTQSVSTSETTVAQTTDSQSSVTAEQSQQSSESSSNAQTSSNSETSQAIIVPTKNGADVQQGFSASFTPYKAYDEETNSQVELNEVFGSSYRGGSINFSENSTFNETFSAGGTSSGAYVVEGNTITATYTNDKNISISIISKDGNTPTEIMMNYGGYNVYFNW